MGESIFAGGTACRDVDRPQRLGAGKERRGQGFFAGASNQISLMKWVEVRVQGFFAGASNQISLMKWVEVSQPTGAEATDILSYAPLCFRPFHK